MNKNFLNNNIRLGIFLLITFLVLSVFSVNSASARDLMGGPDGLVENLLYKDSLLSMGRSFNEEVIIENRMHMDKE